MARNLLFSVPNTASLTANESAFKSHREALGDTFTLIAHGDAVPGDLSAYQGVVFSDTMQTNQAAKWDSVEIAVFSMSIRLFLHTDQASVTFASGGDSRLTRYIQNTVATADAPQGLVTVYTGTPTSTYDWIQDTNLAPNVVQYALHQAAGTRITGILIPAGTTLLNSSVSPNANRATSSTDDYVNLTTDGWTLIDEVFEWAVPDGTPGSIPANASVATTRYIELDASASTGETPLSYDFTQVSGPAVTLTGTGATRTFEQPDPWDTDIVIDVTVTGSDLDEDVETVTITAPTGTGTTSIGDILVFDGTEWG